MLYNVNMTADSVADVKREVLVRHLGAWAPAALHRARRATYVHGYADADQGVSAEAALRVFVEQSDLVRGRELRMLALAGDVSALGSRLDAVPADAAGLTVHPVAGGTDERLAVALQAVGAARVPMLGYLDATAASGPPSLTTVKALAGGKPAEALLVFAAGALAEGGDRVFGDGRWQGQSGGALVDAYRSALSDAGFPLVAAVELVAGEGEGELLIFATTSAKSLEAFKDLLWAVDEYAGVRYRDPGDPERHLIDISLNPHPGPLRREILHHLTLVKQATVTELRTYALTETVYRAADATRVLHALIDSGTVHRQPEHGRLGGDVVITAEPA
jgi:hypothetical protein